jgi:hypothetical protein
MIDGEKQLSAQIVLPSKKDIRQESLQRQLNQLDSTQPGDRVLGKFLSMLYNPENHQKLDEILSAFENVRYQPSSALSGHITHSPLGDFVGIYEYKPITEAVKSVEDYFNIFPEIEAVFNHSKNGEILPIVLEVAKTISKKTNIHVVFSQPDLSGKNDWILLKNGYIIHSRIEENNLGQHNYVYYGTSQTYSDLMARGYPNPEDLELIGDAIILNKDLIDNHAMISTCLHELGHIAENRFLLPQKEQEFPNQRILGTEVLSSLYGLKTALLMSNQNPDLSFQMIQNPISLYNWVLTGTVAPKL